MVTWTKQDLVYCICNCLFETVCNNYETNCHQLLIVLVFWTYNKPHHYVVMIRWLGNCYRILFSEKIIIHQTLFQQIWVKLWENLPWPTHFVLLLGHLKTFIFHLFHLVRDPDRRDNLWIIFRISPLKHI